MVERTFVSLLERSSAWAMGVGNFPATDEGLNNLGAVKKRCTIPWKGQDPKGEKFA